MFVMPFRSRELMGVIILLKVVQTTMVASTRLDHKLGRLLTGVQLSQQTLNICIIFIDFQFGYLTFFTSHFLSYDI